MFIYFFFNLLVYLIDWLSVMLLFSFIITLILLGLIFRDSLRRHGYTEFIYTVVLMPGVVFLGSGILTNEYSLLPLVEFSNINLLFVVTCITQSCQKDVIEYQESKNQIGIYSLLGKRDSFRVTLFIFFYMAYYSIYYAFKTQKFM